MEVRMKWIDNTQKLKEVKTGSVVHGECRFLLVTDTSKTAVELGKEEIAVVDIESGELLYLDANMEVAVEKATVEIG